MKKIFLLMSSVLLSYGVFSQQQSHEKCGHSLYMNYMEDLYPGYKKTVNSAFNYANSSILKGGDEVYTIPVVVHIVYNQDKPEMNLDDEIVFNQIQVLNDDYNRTNADADNVREAFLPHVGSTNIKFELATVDPDGNPTNGITRTSTTKNSFFGMNIAEDVKSSATGGIDPWNQAKYMNIWVCDMSIPFIGPAVLGYATPPAGLPNWPDEQDDSGMGDGVVVQWQAFGSNNPNELMPGYNVLGRTTTHEVGHYLGLRHIWGDSEDCIEDDGIYDTPNATENGQTTGCSNPEKNTCEDDIFGEDLPDMYENYMDYSDEGCQNSFTLGQAFLMRAVLENFRFELIGYDEPQSVGLKEETLFNATLYPNPADNTVTLETTDLLNGNIMIVNLNGQIVKEIKANGLQTTIDINNLESGIYQVFAEGMIGAVKLVKL